MAADSLLVISGLRKSYTSLVLNDVDFDLRAGEVHALVGENGAGKSTLCRIISGRVQADSGTMRLQGADYTPANPRQAERRGVRMVMQELNLVGNLSVAENIFLNQMPHRFGWISYGKMNAAAREIMARVGLGNIDPARPVRSLGIGQQQMVEIAAALSQRCDILILDEPTAALTDTETELLFEQVARLKAAGTGIIYVSHRMEEIQRIADRITVLRDGKIVAVHPARAVTIDEIVRQMVGRELTAAATKGERKRGEAALRVQGLRRTGAVQDASFEAYRGEILGFAGLMGSGRTETMRLIFGADRAEAGAIFLHGSATAARIRNPRDAVRQGIAFLTENRREEGLLLPMPIRPNITLPRLHDLVRWLGWIEPRSEKATAERFVQQLAVRCVNSEQRVRELSGGNQQKVVLAKWLYRDCDILIFDEPTRGIDVGAKFEIYQLLEELAAKGKAILVVSSDLLELMAISDRIAVMSAGKLAAIFERSQWSQDLIMKAALSGYLAPAS